MSTTASSGSVAWQSQRHMRIVKHAVKLRSMASRRHCRSWSKRLPLSSASTKVSVATSASELVEVICHFTSR